MGIDREVAEVSTSNGPGSAESYCAVACPSGVRCTSTLRFAPGEITDASARLSAVLGCICGTTRAETAAVGDEDDPPGSPMMSASTSMRGPAPMGTRQLSIIDLERDDQPHRQQGRPCLGSTQQRDVQRTGAVGMTA
jgi:hypothetical protein